MLVPIVAVAAAVQVFSAQALTLEEAVAAAFDHAPALAEAEAEMDAAAGRLMQAGAATRPSVTVNGTIGVGWLDPRGYFGLERESIVPRSAQATIEQPLFTGGRAAASIDQAGARRRFAAAARDQVRGQLAAAVAEAFGAVLVAQDQQQLYQRLVDQVTEIERQARLMFEAGEAPRTDISQSAARLAEARAGLARAEGEIVSAVARFRALTGQDGASLAPLPGPPPTPATLEEALPTAEAASPAIAQAEAALQAATAAARLARAERRPTIGAFAEASHVRDQFFPDYKADGATVGVRARWQIMDGGQTSGRIAEASAEERAAEARLRAARVDVEAQVTAAFQAVRTSALVERAKAEQLAAAEEATANVRHEVRVGLKPRLDLLNAEREALAAGVEAARARADRVASAYRLNALLGSF